MLLSIYNLSKCENVEMSKCPGLLMAVISFALLMAHPRILVSSTPIIILLCVKESCPRMVGIFDMGVSPYLPKNEEYIL
ncbi:MAG: hypothetical protein EA394_08275 [Bacteroidia bacterium]|nr:MAG: hypothetical protein EA394_08275 [Bacteroidia bacterium]